MIEPFRISVPQSDLDDLAERLGRTRLTDPPAGEPWESGADYDYLGGLIQYWRDGFDWRAQERRLNTYEHFIVTVGSQRVHAMRVTADRERYPEPIAIVLSHGWPYSFLEFIEFADHLTDPEAHGDNGTAFDVVIPSLPGYGFSPVLSDGPFIAKDVAILWHRMMTAEFGYQEYATYGEDVGTTVSDWIGALYPESVIGLFATHAAFPPEDRMNDLSSAEKEFQEWLRVKWATASGYSEIQSTRPDTLAVGLNDSPAGLLAWLLEKFYEWSGPDFVEAWTKDEILTTVSLYWFTQTIGTSFLPYYHGRVHSPALPMIEVPVGVAVQHGERGFPREYAERTYTNVRMWTELPRGGHFTAKQTPDLVGRAMSAFFASI